MPANPEEVIVICKILGKYLPWDKAKLLIKDLCTTIGAKTNNYSLRTTLVDLAEYIYEDPLQLFSK